MEESNSKDGKPDHWKKCSSCKKPILFSSIYYVCSVSTCTGQRTGYVFCSVSCFERHLPGARHRSAGAIEKKSPSLNEFLRQLSQDQQQQSDLNPPTSTGYHMKNQPPREVLIIASRLKEYIQTKADMNTSASVMEILSDYIRVICDRAIDEARAEGRKTVMDRDLQFLKKIASEI